MRTESATLALAVLIATACRPSPQSNGARDSSDVVNVAAQPAQDSLPLVTVYKSPTCGCCTAWVDHMRNAGFRVATVDTADVNPVKQRHGVPDALGSCHTATIGQYVIEGHVPAEDIRRLLAETRDVKGLAVPGMPVGSPGMEGAYRQAYEVIAFTSGAASSVFARH